jgi:recombinase-like zinc beta ribbon protein
VGETTNGVESKYLLTGLVACGLCGGGVYVATRSHGKSRTHYYACATFHRKGHTVCPNNQQVVMADADWALMEVVQDELLVPLISHLPESAEGDSRDARISIRVWPADDAHLARWS